MTKIFLIREPNPDLGIIGQTQEFPYSTLAEVQAFCDQLNKDNPEIPHYIKIEN